MNEGVNSQGVLFENPVTKLYKTAASYNPPSPVSNIVLSLSEDNPQQINYVHISQAVYFYHTDRSMNLLDIYKTLLPNNSNLTVNTVVYAYIELLSNASGMEDFILAEIRNIYKEVDPENTNIINSYSDIRTFFDLMTKFYEKQVVIDYKRAVEIINIQKTLAHINSTQKHFLRTSTIVNRATFAVKSTIDGREVTINDGYDIFNKSIISQYVPFIQYNDSNSKKFYKLYRGKSLDMEPNYTNTMINPNNTGKPNTIYMTLWLGDLDCLGNDSIHNAPKDTFQDVVFDLDNNRMVFDVPFTIRGSRTSNETTSIERLSGSLPMLVMGNRKEIKVKAELKMIPFYGDNKHGKLYTPEVQFDIYNHAFLHMVLNDNIMFQHIYTEESMKPYPMKQRLDLHYRPLFSDIDESTTPIAESYISNSSSVSFMATVKTTSADETFTVIDNNGHEEKIVVSPGYNYINISIKRSESREAILEFVDVIELLLVYYFWGIKPTPMEDLIATIRYYEAIVPGGMNVHNYNKQREEIKKSMKVGPKNVRSGERISELSKNHPNVFGGCFSRKCQSYRQPKAVATEAEAIEWSNKTFIKDGVERKRDYIPYPAKTPNPEFYIVCPDDRAPHPGVIPNSTGHNQDIYPYVPCCFSSSQIKSKGGNYARYYLDGKADDQDRSDMIIKKTKTSLEDGRIGYLPIDISGILNQETIKREIIRYGIPRSKSSLLHAVMVATNNQDYYNSYDKEDTVNKMRSYMARNVRPELLKQEMYDISNDEIVERLGDPNIFLDPSIYYRALEVIFNINIYVFSVNDIKENTGGKMEIPRHSEFHSRPLRDDRPTVIIYKHIGSESDSLDYPQCELILDTMNNDNLAVKMFGKDITRSCHFIMENTLSTITWTQSHTNDESSRTIMNAYKNIYNIVDFNKAVDGAVSQYIDSSGKTRALTFYHNGKLVTTVTIPTQPINVPHTEVIEPVTTGVAMELFNNPSSIVVRNGEIRGIWFTILGMKDSIYFRLSDYDNSILSLPHGPPDPITTGNDNTLERINKLKRVLSIYNQLLKWSMIVFKANNQDLMNIVDVFFANYVLIDNNSIVDSLTYYDFSNVPYHLPKVQRVEDCIRHIANTSRGMIHDNKIVMYSQDFYNSILGDMKTYDSNTHGKEIEVPYTLEDYYVNHRDFIQMSGVEVFVGERDIVNWVHSRKAKGNQPDMKTTISVSSANSTTPIIYRHSNGAIYMIQNPTDGYLNSACAICVAWAINTVNIGPDPIAMDDENLPSRIIYGISPNGDLVAIEDQTGGNTSFVSIVYYGTQFDRDNGTIAKYGAMLPIL